MFELFGLIFFVFLLWGLPMLLCGWIASGQGKSVKKVVVCAFVAGWIGGILALILLDAETEGVEDRPVVKAKSVQPLSATRKVELEKLLGGKK